MADVAEQTASQLLSRWTSRGHGVEEFPDVSPVAKKDDENASADGEDDEEGNGPSGYSGFCFRYVRASESSSRVACQPFCRVWDC